MIDLHSHILPGIDDGSPDIATSLEMARMAVADGITMITCTPHLYPGLYDTKPQTISKGVTDFQTMLNAAGIALRLFTGADVHIAPDLITRLRDHPIYRLNESRYFLLELPRHIPPPRIEPFIRALLCEGLIPIITHPERLSWIDTQHGLLEKINDLGCLVQITGGSLEGSFGRTARKRALRLLKDGRVDLIASDAHNTTSRPPKLAAARCIVTNVRGEEEARALTYARPVHILKDKKLSPRCHDSRKINAYA